MRHTYECPLRWADMDLLGHVNNVTFVDYLQEARIDMLAIHASFRGGEQLAEGVVVVNHQVEFVAPLVYRRRPPVYVDVWVTEVRAASFTLAYEVYGDDPRTGLRVVHLRARSVLAPYVFATERPRRVSTAEREVLDRFLEPTPPLRPLELQRTDPNGAHGYPLKVRFSDVDAYRHVNNVQYVEFFQEARIQFLMDLHEKGQKWREHVVARTDVRYRRPVLFRSEPYDVRSWVSRVGTRSFVVSSEIRDDLAGGEVLARGDVVMVTFDAQTQASAEMAESQRARLLAAMEDSRPLLVDGDLSDAH